MGLECIRSQSLFYFEQPNMKDFGKARDAESVM